jgi:hypothetical protein
MLMGTEAAPRRTGPRLSEARKRASGPLALAVRVSSAFRPHPLFHQREREGIIFRGQIRIPRRLRDILPLKGTEGFALPNRR